MRRKCGFLTSRGYRAAKTRPASARAIRDALLGVEITRLHAENYGVYGVRKMHALMCRQGWPIGRDQTGRIMRAFGVEGVRRSRRVCTTRSDPAAERPTDLAHRQFIADAPCRLWVSDITYVATWSGFAYVAFITDVFSRRIVGWSVAGTETVQNSSAADSDCLKRYEQTRQQYLKLIEGYEPPPVRGAARRRRR